MPTLSPPDKHFATCINCSFSGRLDQSKRFTPVSWTAVFRFTRNRTGLTVKLASLLLPAEVSRSVSIATQHQLLRACVYVLIDLVDTSKLLWQTELCSFTPNLCLARVAHGVETLPALTRSLLTPDLVVHCVPMLSTPVFHLPIREIPSCLSYSVLSAPNISSLVSTAHPPDRPTGPVYALT